MVLSESYCIAWSLYTELEVQGDVELQRQGWRSRAGAFRGDELHREISALRPSLFIPIERITVRLTLKIPLKLKESNNYGKLTN